ncbi:hypothetical protein F5X97DRAFT_337766 [Nemania serpens]|nr:hypothetical protein F5X97DRAFT_337766 [Nemania serpens]
MCTGIIHIYRCKECRAAVYKLREAAKGYTCYQARGNRGRGLCRTGINYTSYDVFSEDLCLYCELYLSSEIRDLTSETCDEGGEPWLEDREGDMDISGGGLQQESLDDESGDEVEEKVEKEQEYGKDEEDDEDDEDYEDDEDEDYEDDEDDDSDEEEEGGAKVR